MTLYDIKISYTNIVLASNEYPNNHIIKKLVSEYFSYYFDKVNINNLYAVPHELYLESDCSNIDNLFPKSIYVYDNDNIKECTYKEYWSKYMDNVEVKEITLLSKDEYLRHKDNIKVFDWFWLRDDGIMEDYPCWKQIGPDEYDIGGETELRPMPIAYIVNDDSQSIETEIISRGDVSLRYAIKFNSNHSLKPGTKLIYGDSKYLQSFTVLEDGLALSDFCGPDTYWNDENDSNIEESLKWSNSEAKRRCDSFYNQNGTCAIII